MRTRIRIMRNLTLRLQQPGFIKTAFSGKPVDVSFLPSRPILCRLASYHASHFDVVIDVVIPEKELPILLY